MSTYLSCLQSDGGYPKCGLGFHARSVETRGASLDYLKKYHDGLSPIRDDDEFRRDYDIMIVIDSPNMMSDKTGIINNRSVDKLLEFCKKAQLDFKKVFVTYAVKCHSYKRKPVAKEIKACVDHLKHEVERLNPKVIMLLGGIPVRALKIRKGINVLRGKVHEHPLPEEEKKRKIVVSVDPAMFFVNPNTKYENRIIQDYILAKSAAEGNATATTHYQCKYNVVKSIDEVEMLANQLNDSEWFAFDTESRSLPYTREPMMCMSFSLGVDKNWIVPIYQHDKKENKDDWQLRPYWPENTYKKVFSVLKEIFENPSIAKAAHNIKYDINVLRFHTGIRLKGFTFDTMTMHHCINEQGPHSLEFLSDCEFAVGDYSSKIHDIVGRGKKLKVAYDHIPDDILWPYAANDAECVWRLKETYQSQMAPHIWNLYKEETEPLTHTLARLEWAGYQVDEDKLDILIQEYDKEKTALAKKIEKDTSSGFNPMSPDQVSKVFIEKGYEEEIKDESKAKGFSTGKEILGELKSEIDLADDILTFRNLNKMISTYLLNVRDGVDNDGRLRYSFLIHGTETARLANRFFQQVPRVDPRRKNNIRDMLVAKDGYILVYVDYSQLELRVFAIVADDKEMQTILADPNADIHCETGSEILGFPITKADAINRQVGKDVNFGIIYGSEGYQLIKKGEWEDKDGVRRPLTWNMLDKGMKRFNKRYPSAAEYLEELPNMVRSNGGIYRTVFSRDLHFGSKLNDKDEVARRATERKLVNASIQSPSGAIMCRTMNIIDSYITEWTDKGLEEGAVQLVNTVHDSATYEVRKDLVSWFSPILSDTAQRKIPQLENNSFPVKMGTGQTWSEAEADAD